jgi:hypothetical protein
LTVLAAAASRTRPDQTNGQTSCCRLYRLAEEWLDGTYAAEILVTPNLMVCNAAIYCTLVVRDSLVVSLR